MIRRLFDIQGRSLVAAITVFSLLLAGTAGAAVYIYSNEFQSKSRYGELKFPAGGACKETYNKTDRSLRARVRAKQYCGIRPPITSDSDQPNHEIIVEGRVLKSTPKAAKRGAYLAVRARSGNGTYYEFRISPQRSRYRLRREPSVAGLPLAGKETAIKGLGKLNKIRLVVTDNEVRALINGQLVETFTDPNPGQVTGRAVVFGLGSERDREKGPKGTIESVRVGVPNP